MIINLWHYIIINFTSLALEKVHNRLSLFKVHFRVVESLFRVGTIYICQVHKIKLWCLDCLKCSKISDSVMNVLYENEALHWFCVVCNTTVIRAIQTFNPQSDVSFESASDSVQDLIKRSVEGIKKQINIIMCWKLKYRLKNP